MYMASLELTGHFTVALQEEDFISLTPSTRRAVQSDGISFNNRTYDSPHLLPYRRLRNIDGSTSQVEVHFDPSDRNQIWVRAEDNSWITCRWTVLPGMERPLDSELMRRAGDFSRQGATLSDDEADDLLLELRDAIEREALERDQAERKQLRADRLAERRAAKRAQRAMEIDDDDDDFEFEAV